MGKEFKHFKGWINEESVTTMGWAWELEKIDIENNEAACVIKDYHEATKIQTAWLAVVEFIQWHNKNTASVGSR